MKPSEIRLLEDVMVVLTRGENATTGNQLVVWRQDAAALRDKISRKLEQEWKAKAKEEQTQ